MKSISSEIVNKVTENLIKNEMEALYFATAREAREEVMKRIPPGVTVGIGGIRKFEADGALGGFGKERQ